MHIPRRSCTVTLRLRSSAGLPFMTKQCLASSATWMLDTILPLKSALVMAHGLSRACELELCLLTWKKASCLRCLDRHLQSFSTGALVGCQYSRLLPSRPFHSLAVRSFDRVWPQHTWDLLQLLRLIPRPMFPVRRSSILTDVSGAGNNWAHGHDEYGPMHREGILERVRSATEKCDSIQCFSLLFSMGNSCRSASIICAVLERHIIRPEHTPIDIATTSAKCGCPLPG